MAHLRDLPKAWCPRAACLRDAARACSARSRARWRPHDERRACAAPPCALGHMQLCWPPESSGMQTQKRGRHTMRRGDCTDPSPKATALGLLGFHSSVQCVSVCVDTPSFCVFFHLARRRVPQVPALRAGQEQACPRCVHGPGPRHSHGPSPSPRQRVGPDPRTLRTHVHCKRRGLVAARSHRTMLARQATCARPVRRAQLMQTSPGSVQLTYS